MGFWNTVKKGFSYTPIGMVWDAMKGPGELPQGPDAQAAANEYLNKIPGELHNAYDPYAQQGQAQYGSLNQNYGRMSSDPAAYLENIMKGYEPSKAHQLALEESLRASGNSAAAGGMRGSIGDMQDSANIAGRLQGQDMQQWLANVMGIQGQGMQGQQHLYDTGFQASSNLGSDLSNALATQGSLAFQGARDKQAQQMAQWQAQQQHRQNMFGNAGTIIGGGAGLALSGGNPWAAMAGANIGGQMGSRFS